MLTGKRQFKRTGLKETKNKVGTENAREKKQQTIVHKVGTLSYSLQMWTECVQL